MRGEVLAVAGAAFVLAFLARGPNTATISALTYGGRTFRFNTRMRDTLIALAAKAANEGIALGITSGLRTYAEQQALWLKALARYKDPAVARKWTAPPGHSKHESGNAVDFLIDGITPDSTNVSKIKASKGYKWLRDNAPGMGLRQYGAEPWHWELV